MHRRYQYIYLLSSLFLFIAGFILMTTATSNLHEAGELSRQADLGATLLILSVVAIAIGVIVELLFRLFKSLSKYHA